MHKIKIATPISHLFQNLDNAKLIINNSDILECRDHTIDSNYSNQEIFHCDLQPIHTFSDNDYNLLKKIRDKKKNLKLISFHLASCYKYPKLIKNVFQPNGDKLSKKQLIDNASKNIRYIKEFFGPSVKIAVENNNYLKTEAYDYITDPEFISSIVNENNIYFLLDISHARISSYNMNISYTQYISLLPLEKIIQIHMSRELYKTNGEVYDAHEIPDNNDIKEFKRLISDYPNIKYVTLEYYKDMDELNKFLINLKKIIDEK